ncbi:Asp23/Gls24 family envelope stress response protein [Kineococcus terrestris]|uniref:Asp23/Gls24 family envelope stress response protein n=1 Tax=Kineococcus terrestris TaxID=2044856 RepID=UPI0034DB3CFE
MSDTGDRPTTGATPDLTTDLTTDHGATSTTGAVIAKIVALAAAEVPGVHALGTSADRALSALPDHVPGVRVDVGEREAAVELQLSVEHGTPVDEVAAAVRRGVSGALERMTDLRVTRVDLRVVDVHVPTGDGG